MTKYVMRYGWAAVMMMLFAAVAPAQAQSGWVTIRTSGPQGEEMILNIRGPGELLGEMSILDHVPRSAAVHALTAGAMTTMILAVMTRATLGHTARALKANGGTVALYACVTLAALLRVVASLGLGSSLLLLEISGFAWIASLVLFIVIYGPMLWKPRLD